MTEHMDVHSLVRRGFEIGMVQIEAEILALASAVASLEPLHVLEIGSDLGGTFYIWSQLARGRKISVDLPGGPFGQTGARAARSRMAAFADGCQLIDGDSHAPHTLAHVVAALDGALLDFLFIDGDHSEAGVRRDWEMYSPLLRPGGLAAFHDVNDTPRHRAAGCMVGKFWAGLGGAKTTITSGADWGGIGLVRREVHAGGIAGQQNAARREKGQTTQNGERWTRFAVFPLRSGGPVHAGPRPRLNPDCSPPRH